MAVAEWACLGWLVGISRMWDFMFRLSTLPGVWDRFVDAEPGLEQCILIIILRTSFRILVVHWFTAPSGSP